MPTRRPRTCEHHARSPRTGGRSRSRAGRRYFNRDHPLQQIPTITLHGLRHTWATLAVIAGIDIKIVSERLNHSTTHITREIYTHVTPPMQSDAAEQVRAPTASVEQEYGALRSAAGHVG